MKIAEIKGREILDSRGNPTVEVDVILESGRKCYFGRIPGCGKSCRQLSGYPSLQIHRRNKYLCHARPDDEHH